MFSYYFLPMAILSCWLCLCDGELVPWTTLQTFRDRGEEGQGQWSPGSPVNTQTSPYLTHFLQTSMGLNRGWERKPGTIGGKEPGTRHEHRVLRSTGP